MGEDEYNLPITIGRPFLSTVKAIIYIGTGGVLLMQNWSANTKG